MEAQDSAEMELYTREAVSDMARKQKYTWLIFDNLWSFYLKSSKRETYKRHRISGGRGNKIHF